MGNPLQTPPGWYQNASGQQQYWDGQQWLQAPPKAKNNTAVIILAVITLFFGGCAALVAIGSSGSSKSRETTAAAPPSASPDNGGASQATARIAPPSQAPPPKPGAPVRDGQFEFRVTAVEAAKTIGDNEYLQATAQGVFVIFTLQVTNIGNEARNFSAMAQKLIDMDNRKYDASSTADMNLNRSDSLGQVNPGISTTVKVAFDVPPTLKMKALELHDSILSGGVWTPASAS